MTSNSESSIMTKNITVTLLEKIVPNVKIDFNEVLYIQIPTFITKIS